MTGGRPTHAAIGLAAGLIAFAALLAAPVPEGMQPAAMRMAAVASLMALWWITEAVPIAVTALLPVALFPLLGIMSSARTALSYGNHVIFLFLAGFIIALATEKWNLHRRMALATIDWVGTGPRRIVLGFMLATALLSMWITNTATTMLMLPIAMAVVNQLCESARIDGDRDGHTAALVRTTFGCVLLLGIAFAASIGGIGTIIGTATTVAFLGFLAERFPEQPPISFLDWSLVGVPIIAVYLPIAWLYLCRFGSPVALKRIDFAVGPSLIRQERSAMGRMTPPEWGVAAIFLLTAIGWVFRSPIDFGFLRIPGWSEAFARPADLHDTTVGMAMAALLFLVPSYWGRSRPDGPRTLMDWETVQQRVPWGIILLLGGGFALAAGMESSGLAAWLGERLAILRGVPVWLLVPLLCFCAVLLTEVTSNIATILMLAPVLVEAAQEIGVQPLLLLIPTTIMVSFAFMLPVATPPNAIVFSSGWITIPRMFRAGFLLDVLALLVVPPMVYLIGSAVFGL